MKYKFNNDRPLGSFNLLTLKGWWAVLIWLSISILFGYMFRGTLHAYWPELMSFYFLNYIVLTKDTASFLSILLCFFIFMPFFCLYIFIKGIHNFKLSTNNRTVFGVLVVGGVLLNSQFVDYTKRTKVSNIFYQIILDYDWQGAIAVCFFFLLIAILSGLIILKDVCYLSDVRR